MTERMGKSNDISLIRVLAVLSILGVLFCSGSAASICYSGYTLPIAAVLVITWVLVFLTQNPRLRLLSPEALTLCVLTGGAIFSLLLSRMVGWTSCVTFLCVLCVAYLLVRVLGIRPVARGFVGTMEVVAVISLIGFFVFEVLGVNPPFPTMMTHTGSTIYSNAIIFVVDLGMNSGRNVGLFWEPSIYAAYINVSIAILLFCDRSNRRTKRLALFILVLLTTESAGGLIELLCILVAYWYRQGSKPLVVVSLVALVAAFVLTYTQLQSMLLSINYDLFYKFFGGSNSGTTQTRLECPILNMQIWLQSPLFGSGFYGADTMYDDLRMSSVISNLAQTSTVTYLPAAIGVFGFALFIACIYGFAKIVDLPAFSKIALFIAVMVFLNEEPCTYFVAMYLLVFMLLGLQSVARPCWDGIAKN